MRTEIYVTTSFPGFHCWREAPTQVAFLRNLHRHVFFVEVGLQVEKSREIEFFMFKEVLNRIIGEALLPELKKRDYSMSCEDMAQFLVDFLKTAKYEVLYVEVSEDNENGARITL